MTSVLFEIYNLLRTGKIDSNFYNHRKIIQNLIICFCLLLFLSILSITIISLVFYGFSWQIPQNLSSKEMNNKIWGGVLIIVVVGPIIEELGYRLGLKYSKLNFSTMLFFLSYFIISDLTSSEYYKYDIVSIYKGTFSLMLSIVSFLVLRNTKYNIKLQNTWEYHPKKIFYLSVFLFSFSHIFNFEITPKLVLLTPLFTLPQTIYGILFGYVRLKYGVQYSILLHGMINATPIIISHFSK